MKPGADRPAPGVLLIHGDVYGFGGAENHCVRVAEVLQNLGCQVTLLHAGGPLDADRIYSWCGIRLDPRRVRFITASPFDKFPGFLRGLVLLRYAFVLRAAAALVGGYDLVIGTYGEVPIRVRKLIQSTHVPLFFHDKESLAYLGFNADRDRLRYWIRILYVLASRRIARWSKPPIEAARLLLTNSGWTARQFLRHYPGAKPQVMYQGAQTELDARSPDFLSFEQRADNFVILGRVAPAKRLEVAVEIIDALRARGREVGLIIIGSGAGGYADEIAGLIEARPHISWRRNLSRREVERLVVTQKWGLHCAPHEHYGLAALELLRLGCVVFVPDNGGQAEVVNDPRLRYSSVEDARVKIEAVLDSPRLQDELRAKLSEVTATHTVDRFRASLLQHVGAVLQEE
jgi:glycosyltransferase involved in cell wall biosynthesis